MAAGHVFLLCLITLATVVLPSVNSAKVLMIPFHQRSHINIFRNLGKALADDGHDVFILASDKWSKQLNGYKVVHVEFSLPKGADYAVRLQEAMLEDPTGKTILEKAYAERWPELGRHCDALLTNKVIMKSIREEGFNLAIMDGALGLQCTYTVPYKFNIPYITFHGMQTASWAAGVTGMPSIEPDTLLEQSNRMSFWERVANLQAWLNAMEDPWMTMFDERFIQTYVPEKPLKKFANIIQDSEMFLLNYEVLCLDYPRVSAPNYQYLGPSTVSPAQPLPKAIEEFVQGAEHGVVIMSLGSFRAWQYAWLIIRDKMFKAFGKLKQRVIVQYDMDNDDFDKNIPDNVLTLKWLPQIDLLAHPKSRLFVTHGGNNGQNEAVFYGVPMLVIPIMINQPYAGVRAVAHGYGNYVKDKEAITSEELLQMMQDILNNASYSDNIKRCSRIVRSMPTAQERFVFWVNHILEFGGRHLRPPSLDMPLYEVLMLDVVAFYVGIGVVGIHLVLVSLYFICRCAFKFGKAKKD